MIISSKSASTELDRTTSKKESDQTNWPIVYNQSIYSYSIIIYIYIWIYCTISFSNAFHPFYAHSWSIPHSFWCQKPPKGLLQAFLQRRLLGQGLFQLLNGGTMGESRGLSMNSATKNMVTLNNNMVALIDIDMEIFHGIMMR